MWIARVSCCLLVLASALNSHADVVLTEGTNLSLDSHPSHGIVFDLLGGIWVLEQGASVAEPLASIETGARQPRWSPDGQSILFERPATADLAILDVASDDVARLTTGRNARWHPDGERVLYVGLGSQGLTQLFEIDVRTGLNWQVTHEDEAVVAGVWSADGQQLAYITQKGERFKLRLRNARESRILVESEQRLSSPAFRPDNSLITFVRHGDALSMEMAILAETILVRTLVSEPDLFDSPLVWRNRQQMLYAANGGLRRRDFDSWIPRRIPFRAQLDIKTDDTDNVSLPAPDNSGEAWVLRVNKLFDGRRTSFRGASDIVIQGDTIIAVEPPRDRGRLQIIKMGQAVAIPGLIDACSKPPRSNRDARQLLGHGILTLVPSEVPPSSLNPELSPRLLTSGCADAVPQKRYIKQQLARISPAGKEYEDSRLDASGSTAIFLSGIAQAPVTDPPDPFTELAIMDQPVAGKIALASATNQWPLPLAAIAELRALTDGSRDTLDALMAATGTAAQYLGLDGQLGTLEAGARADIVLLASEPKQDLTALRSPIAIVLRGRLIGRSALSLP